MVCRTSPFISQMFQRSSSRCWGTKWCPTNAKTRVMSLMLFPARISKPRTCLKVRRTCYLHMHLYSALQNIHIPWTFSHLVLFRKLRFNLNFMMGKEVHHFPFCLGSNKCNNFIFCRSYKWKLVRWYLSLPVLYISWLRFSLILHATHVQRPQSSWHGFESRLVVLCCMSSPSLATLFPVSLLWNKVQKNSWG